MFEPGKKYIFSRTAFWNDMHVTKNLSHDSWWINIFDGHLFVGLGGESQKITKGDKSIAVLPEWCIDGEAPLL